LLGVVPDCTKSAHDWPIDWSAPRRQPRPVYYTRDQLDELCEKIVVDFCMERYGQELNAIPTEALLQLLEEHAHDVDQTADLPEGINGVTEY
jgi:hypothetical protein